MKKQFWTVRDFSPSRPRSRNAEGGAAAQNSTVLNQFRGVRRSQVLPLSTSTLRQTPPQPRPQRSGRRASRRTYPPRLTHQRPPPRRRLPKVKAPGNQTLHCLLPRPSWAHLRLNKNLRLRTTLLSSVGAALHHRGEKCQQAAARLPPTRRIRTSLRVVCRGLPQVRAPRRSCAKTLSFRRGCRVLLLGRAPRRHQPLRFAGGVRKRTSPRAQSGNASTTPPASPPPTA